MKKFMILVLCVMVFATLAMAQTYTKGSGITGVDKLGAHQNGGRGCTGCHAPHSGGAGGGGNAAGTAAAAFNDPNSGTVALWGQDTTPLFSYVITSGNGYVEVLPPADADANNSKGEVTGIMFCLSCHDGNVAKGGMMTNALYEQKNNLLPTNLYGPNTIPTLLANDGSTNNYTNDHPVGINATIKAVLGSNANAFTFTSNSITYTANVNTNYDKFVSNYGNFFQGRATLGYTSGAADGSGAFVLCTTCHTPHTMYTSSGTWAGVKGTYPTYFFLVAPYDPGSKPTAQQASSATQFCRSCHFTGAGGSNEGSGIFSVTTAF